MLKQRASLAQTNVKLDWKARGESVYNTLTATAQGSQAGLLAFLSQRGIKHRAFWIVNTVRVEADQATIDEIAKRPDVDAILPDRKYSVPKPTPGTTILGTQGIEWNISNIRAPEAWDTYGFRGEGIVVANIDTGVQYDHPALVRQYRGTLANGSYDHNYNWYDPANVCGNPSTAPCDNVDHGTHTMGTMVGADGEPGGGRDGGTVNQIGVAPHARWIAAKGCEYDSCSPESLLAAAQWVLAPTDLSGQNPRVDLRPNIVNNSWGSWEHDEFYEPAVQAWVAAGIFPAFSNGNAGSACKSSGSPGDYAESYSAGAYDQSNLIADFSSRGPFGDIIKPDISAPGVNVRSSVPSNNYAVFSGTSMASPHVAGVVALLWSAAPDLLGDIARTREVLDKSAVDTPDLSCGGADGDNNVYGEGRLNVLAAMDLAPIGPSGTLAGSVTQAADGLPIAKASILMQGGKKDRTTLTGPDGAYSVPLSAGTYTVTANAFGFVSQSVPGVQISEGATTTQSFALVQAPSYSLAGTVRDSTGAGLSGALVSILNTPLPSATANTSGLYQFASVPAGEYDVKAEAGPCFAPVVSHLVLSANATLDFTLPISTDQFGYHCEAASYSFVDANTVLLSNYNYEATVTLPFSFTFYGQTYDTATVNAYGYMNFVTSPYGTSYNRPIPDAQPPNGAIYPFWDDLYVDSTSTVRTEVLGEAPRRQFVVEWRDMMSYSHPERVRFEVVLFETGQMTMQYATGDTPWQRGGEATIGIENASGTVGFQYSYNKPSVQAQSAIRFTLPPYGIVQGNITDANDGRPVAATVQALQGKTVVASTTPTKSGFYRLMVPPGSYTVVASMKNYGDAQVTVRVAVDDVLPQDFALKTGRATVTPPTLQIVMSPDQTRTRTLTLNNTGSLPYSWTLAESGGRKQAVKLTRLLKKAEVSNPNAMSTKTVFDLGPSIKQKVLGWNPLAAGDVLASWAPQGMQLAWGVGVADKLWLSDAPSRVNTEFSVEGTPSGRSWPASWASSFPGDMALDTRRNLMCQVNVGGDNGIYCWDTATGQVSYKISAGAWTAISQRGLAYRAEDDTFFIGGWNDGIVYHIKGASAADPGTVISSCSPPDYNISGLAYNPAMDVLWIATNSETDTIYEVNPYDCTVLSTLAHPSPMYNGGGLEMDESGNLWMISQSPNKVYLMDSGVPAFNDVPWLAGTPSSGKVEPGKTGTLHVTIDTTGLETGIYLGSLYIRTTTGATATLRVPVSLVVTDYQQAVNAGGLAYNDSLGDSWAADQAYSEGSWGYVQESSVLSTTKPIKGAVDATLYQTQRVDPYAYRFDSVPNGMYEIDMRYAEITNLKFGKRLYDVIIENTLVLPAHDVAYEVGDFAADDHKFFVEVTDQRMDVRFIPRAGYELPIVNALRITRRPDR